jgi:hypothetical protein
MLSVLKLSLNFQWNSIGKRRQKLKGKVQPLTKTGDRQNGN